MIFQTHIPRYPLSHFIGLMIYHEAYQPLHSVDRFLPDGNVEIIIDLNDRPQYIYDNETLKEIQACHRVWASGVRSEPITIPSGKDSAMMIIAFKRGMAYPFFPFPMNEILDSVVDADLIWGESFTFLRESLLETRDISRRFALAEDFLMMNFACGLEQNPCIEFGVNAIIHQPDQISLSRLSEKIGYSQKHFSSMFKKQVGLSPKSYLKIMRFQKAIDQIEQISERDWAIIAADCGFYDQAHFINDFKLFSGFTPEEYAIKKSDQLNYVPMG